MVPTKLVAGTLALLSGVVVGIGSASAQVPVKPAQLIQPQTIETSFPFVVGGKTVPAGKYVVEQTARDLLVFRPVSGKGQPVEAPVLTRLAQPSPPVTESKIVFDKVNDTYFISEVWLPGEDGFLLGGIKEEHTNQTVKATKK